MHSCCQLSKQNTVHWYRIGFRCISRRLRLCLASEARHQTLLRRDDTKTANGSVTSSKSLHFILEFKRRTVGRSHLIGYVSDEPSLYNSVQNCKQNNPCLKGQPTLNFSLLVIHSILLMPYVVCTNFINEHFTVIDRIIIK